MRILLLSIIILISAAIHAQVWTLEKGSIYANLSLSYGLYNEVFDSTGEVVEIPVEILDQTVDLFVQYGITDKLTAQIDVPYKFIRSTGDLYYFNQFEGTPYLQTGRLNDFGNISAGGIYRIVNDKPIITASLFVELNTSERNYLKGMQTGFNSLGIQPGFGAAWAFPKAWFTFYLGGDIRTNNYSSSVNSKMELGYQPYPGIYVAGLLTVKQSVGNGGDCDCTTNYTGLYLNDQEFTAFGLKAGYAYKNFGLNGAYHIGLSGKNLSATPYLSVGLQYKKVLIKPDTPSR